MSRDYGPVGIKNFRVKIGTVYHNQDPDIYSQTLNVSECILHPHYDRGRLLNDIALLKLQDPATLNARVKIARIAEKRNRVGEHCVLAGWGMLSLGEVSWDKLPERLQEVSVSYV